MFYSTLLLGVVIGLVLAAAIVALSFAFYKGRERK